MDTFQNQGTPPDHPGGVPGPPGKEEEGRERRHTGGNVSGDKPPGSPPKHPPPSPPDATGLAQKATPPAQSPLKPKQDSPQEQGKSKQQLRYWSSSLMTLLLYTTFRCRHQKKIHSGKKSEYFQASCSIFSRANHHSAHRNDGHVVSFH